MIQRLSAKAIKFSWKNFPAFHSSLQLTKEFSVWETRHYWISTTPWEIAYEVDSDVMVEWGWKHDKNSYARRKFFAFSNFIRYFIWTHTIRTIKSLPLPSKQKHIHLFISLDIYSETHSRASRVDRIIFSYYSRALFVGYADSHTFLRPKKIDMGGGWRAVRVKTFSILPLPLIPIHAIIPFLSLLLNQRFKRRKKNLNFFHLGAHDCVWKKIHSSETDARIDLNLLTKILFKLFFTSII